MSVPLMRRHGLKPVAKKQKGKITMAKQRLIDVDGLILDIKKNNQANYETKDWTSKQVVELLEESVKMPHLQPKPQWISVAERLPDKELAEFLEANPGEQGVEVLVFIECADSSTTLMYDGNNFCEPHNTMMTYRVTHWMPFPEPPKITEEIVRCNNCKKWDRTKRFINSCACTHWSASSLKEDLRFTPPDGFCCYAEKEEGAEA